MAIFDATLDLQWNYSPVNSLKLRNGDGKTTVGYRRMEKLRKWDKPDKDVIKKIKMPTELEPAAKFSSLDELNSAIEKIRGCRFYEGSVKKFCHCGYRQMI
ncbi:uncharacterized protein [Macrobrachium rosenbergii]|uniref:uncharacterized protein n=1 Tax=Macrobrachium rosenbergii TaxID=79674 RepID=UPI0034D3D880